MDNSSPRPMRNWIVSLLVVALSCTAGYFYLDHKEKYPNTDDAYVHGNIIYVAPQVGGRITAVNVQNYEHVYKGELLIQIDPSIYDAQLHEAKAAYQVAMKKNKAASQAILVASSDITSASANLKKVQLNYKRTMTMVSDGVLPQQEADNARAALVTAREEVSSAKAHMEELVAEQGAAGVEAPAVQQAAAALMQATINLSYTAISAPADGEVGLIKVHPGSVVGTGQSLFPLVQSKSFWVQANYKEDDMGRIRPGMPANIELDMYPDKTFTGHVDAISPASGSSFSLLPPENASGNWVKIPQRFPVSIRFTTDDPQMESRALRVGASATVTVDTVVSDHEQ